MKKFLALVLSCLIMASIAIPAFAVDLYTLKYNMNGVTATPASIADVEKDQTATAEERTVKLAALPTAEGKTCTGWNTKADGTGASYAAGADFEIKEDVTLYAIWKTNTFTLSYSANNVELATSSVELPADKVYDEGTAASICKALTSKANVFKEWNTKADGTGKSYEAGASIVMKEDTTLYAIWTPVKDGYYLLQYDLNGAPGTPPATQTDAYWKDVKVAAAPSIPGYVFKEWNTLKDGQGKAYQPGENYYRYNHDVYTLYAIWSKVPDAPVAEHTLTCVVVIDGKEDTAKSKNVKVAEGADIKPLEIADYEFVAFYAKFADGKLEDKLTAPKMPKDNYTVYAEYKKADPAAKTYKLSFVSNEEAKKFVDQTYKAGDEIKLPDTTLVNFHFCGWFSDKEMTKEFKETKMPAADTVVYAKYAMNLTAFEKVINALSDSLVASVKGMKLTADELNTIVKAAGYKATYKINGKEFEIADFTKLSEEIIGNITKETKVGDVLVLELSFTQNGKAISDETSFTRFIYNDAKAAPQPTEPNSTEPTSTEPSTKATDTEPTNNVVPTDGGSNIPKTGSAMGVAIGAAVALAAAIAVAVIVVPKKKKENDDEAAE